MQSLAQSLQAATTIRHTSNSVESLLSSLGQVQQKIGHAGRLDSERLQQIRQDRDDLKSRLADIRSEQKVADDAVQEAQAHAATKDAEAEVLRRLQDRLDSARRQAQRRRDEQSPLEAVASLCNGRHSG